MFERLTIPSFALMAGILFSSVPSFAEANSSSYKVLANKDSGMNSSAVEKYLEKGDEFIARGEIKKAINEFKKARKLTNLLAGYYRDLNGSFRGLDARIPRELSSKNRKLVSTLAKSNLRLAALHRRQNEPELAVPLLVEVIKLMSPIKPEGQKAYQSLLELGFVETPYAAARKNK